MKHDYKPFASLFLAFVILLYIPAIPSIAFTYSERDADWFNEGYNEGYSEGHNEGYNEGYEDGFGRGYEDGVGETYNSAYDEGYRDAYDEAYAEGYNDHGDNLVPMIGAIILCVFLCRLLYSLYENNPWKKRISK